MYLHLKDFSAIESYHLMTQSIIPRPIAWVLTQNADGESHNLAPFSYFTAVASDPPLVMFSCAPKPEGGVKDTVINSLREKCLVIHIANQSQLQAVQETAKPLAYGESELPLIDASLCDFGETGLKRLRDVPIAFACRLHHSEHVGNAPQTLIFAEIESMYVDDNALSKGEKRFVIDADSIAPLARLGLGQFAFLGDAI